MCLLRQIFHSLLKRWVTVLREETGGVELNTVKSILLISTVYRVSLNGLYNTPPDIIRLKIS